MSPVVPVGGRSDVKVVTGSSSLSKEEENKVVVTRREGLLTDLIFEVLLFLKTDKIFDVLRVMDLTTDLISSVGYLWTPYLRNSKDGIFILLNSYKGYLYFDHIPS